MKTRDRVRRYAKANPDATIRDIQQALKISSPSVVHYHLHSRTVCDRIDELKAQIEAMKRSNQSLHHTQSKEG